MDIPLAPSLTAAKPERALMIARGAILIRNDGHLPAVLLTGGMRPFSSHWSFLADEPGGQVLEKRLATAGWISSGTGPLRRAATGADRHRMITAALERVLAGAGLKSCNCLEIDEVRMHSFLTIPYASVSGHARQLRAETSGAADAIESLNRNGN
jgi:hypothetical protein